MFAPVLFGSPSCSHSTSWPPPVASPTSPSPTQALSAALMLSMATLITHRHARIAFFCSPFVHLAEIASSFLLRWCPESTLHHRLRHGLTSTRSRRQCRCVNLQSSLVLSPNTARCPLLFVHDGRQDQANHRARQAYAQCWQLAAQQQASLNRCHRFVRIRHREATTTLQIDALPSLDVYQSLEVWGSSEGRHYDYAV